MHLQTREPAIFEKFHEQKPFEGRSLGGEIAD